MKREYTFEDYEREKFFHKWGLLYSFSIAALLVVLSLILMRADIFALALPFTVTIIILVGGDDPFTRCMERAKTEYVKVDLYYLKEFRRLSMTAKLFLNNYKGDKDYEFMFIDDEGMICHENVGVSFSAVRLFDCIDEEQVVIYEKKFCDDRFNKEFPLVQLGKRYDVYIEPDNYVQIG